MRFGFGLNSEVMNRVWRDAMQAWSPVQQAIGGLQLCRRWAEKVAIRSILSKISNVVSLVLCRCLQNLCISPPHGYKELIPTGGPEHSHPH